MSNISKKNDNVKKKHLGFQFCPLPLWIVELLIFEKETTTKLVLLLARLTLGYGISSISLSTRDIKRYTGMSTSSIQNAISTSIRRKYVRLGSPGNPKPTKDNGTRIFSLCVLPPDKFSSKFKRETSLFRSYNLTQNVKDLKLQLDKKGYDSHENRISYWKDQIRSILHISKHKNFSSASK